jgi:predicted transcriptional regulator
MGASKAVKTTVELRDDLLRRAKVLAASRGITLKQFLTEAVEQRLRAEQAQPRRPRWKQLAGELTSLQRETARIDAAIAAEFESIDIEDLE